MSRSALLSLLLAGLLLASSLSYSDDLSQRLLTSAERLPLGADFAAVVKNTADNTSLANINGNKLVPPASTLKAVTALAAYYQLGKDFRFTTQFFHESNGDRVLVFSGDPLLSREDLRKLLMRGKGQGTNRITGDFILDGSIFDGHLWSTAQSWSDRHICFAAPSSAINLNHNCVWARLHIGTLGSTVRAEVPSREPIQIISTARVVSLEEQQRSMCSLDLTHDTDNHYVLSGCVVQSDKPMPLYLAIGDPVSYVSQIVRYEASMMNIIIEGTVRTGKVSRDAILLAEHQSAPLPAYLEKMLMESDNLIADVLFKTLGFSYFKFPGNYRNGAAAMRHILRRDANIELGSSYLADGSGLSRYNLMSAATLTDVMQHIALMEDPLLASSLAVAGVSGTLRNRYGLNRVPFKNNVRGKTGHLRGIYNLTGFFTAKNNQQLAFAIIVDGVNQTSQTTRGNRSVNDFYTQFFNKLNAD